VGCLIVTYSDLSIAAAELITMSVFAFNIFVKYLEIIQDKRSFLIRGLFRSLGFKAEL
jgi:hypothetical protein